MSDRLLRIPSLRVAEASQGAPGLPLGACHVAEIPFVWRTLTAPGVDELLTNPPAELSDVMHHRWIEFARTGEPAEWSPYDTETRPVMVFYPDDDPSEDVEKLVLDPRGDERKLWNGRLEPRDRTP